MSFDDEIADLAHDHDFLGARHEENARRTRWVVGLTAVMMVGEIVAGAVYQSMALLADGFHMATHAGALGLAALAYAYARRHARTGRYSFGTGKVGDLAGFASALILAVVALGIAVESGLRLVDPRPVAFTEATVVAIVGLLVNLASALLLGGYGHAHDHGHDHGHGHDHDHDHGRADNNLRSAYVHVLADALTSVLAIAALIGGGLWGWLWLDPLMGLVGAGVIAVWSWGLLRDTGRILLDAAEPELEADVRTCVEGPGDARIADLHVWRLGPGAHAAIVSVRGIDRATALARLAPVRELAHLTVETR